MTMSAIYSAVLTTLKRSWSLLKWRFLKSAFVLAGIPLLIGARADEREKLGPFTATNPQVLQEPKDAEHFDIREALHGSTASSEQCSAIANSLWVNAAGPGECIRYYGSGLQHRANPLVMVYFSGDVLLRNADGQRSVVPSYGKQSPSSITEEMTEWSEAAGVPAIFLARPGLFGSSGDHNKRRQNREIELMQHAISLLKDRYQIQSFIFAGHSGGGQIVAGLLNKRDDIRAAVISSGLVSVKQVTDYWEFRRNIPGRLLYDSREFYDPIDHLKNVAKSDRPDVYVISDPEDQTIPFFTQLRYVRRLKTTGFDPHHIFAHAPDPSHHLLSNYAKIAAAMIAQGNSSAEIRRTLALHDASQIASREERNKSPEVLTITSPYVSAESALSVLIPDATGNTQKILFSKAGEKQLPPASVTKLMTAIVAIDISRKLRLGLSHKIVVHADDLVGGSGNNLKVGDVLSLEAAIANLMLSSSNVTANAVARSMGAVMRREEHHKESDPDVFVRQMNNRAQTLGMTRTVFMNPSGLSASGQVTTAKDLAKLAVEALKYSEVSRVWGDKQYTIVVEGPHARKLALSNPNPLYKDYDIIGGKTGALVPGLFNIVVVSQAPGDRLLVTVSLKSPSENERTRDVRTLIDWAKRNQAK
jgi:D-alanyl-D-alanine carboxypeptidase/dienelactone hydrolase